MRPPVSTLIFAQGRNFLTTYAVRQVPVRKFWYCRGRTVPVSMKNGPKYIVWSPVFELGLEPIDTHHRNLVELINDFHIAVESHLDDEVLVRIFHRLREYGDYHFRVEEAMMIHADFPGAEAHLAAHRSYRENIATLEMNVIRDHRVSQQVLAYLKHWWEQHILVIDREMANHTRAHPVR